MYKRNPMKRMFFLESITDPVKYYVIIQSIRLTRYGNLTTRLTISLSPGTDKPESHSRCCLMQSAQMRTCCSQTSIKTSRNFSSSLK